MRIDGPNEMNVNGPSRPDGALPQPARPRESRTPSPAGTPRSADAALPYIQQAVACEEVDTQAVVEAKKLLESGQLDTPEAAARAAESILSLGI